MQPSTLGSMTTGEQPFAYSLLSSMDCERRAGFWVSAAYQTDWGQVQSAAHGALCGSLLQLLHCLECPV